MCSVLSFLSPDRLAIPDGSSLHLFTLQLPPPPRHRLPPPTLPKPLPTRTPTPQPPTSSPLPFPLSTSIPLRSPPSFLRLHLDGRLCTAGVKDKVLRFHSASLPSYPTSSPSPSSIPSALHLRHDRALPPLTCLLSLSPSHLLVAFEDGTLHTHNPRTGARTSTLTLDTAILTLLPITPTLSALALTPSIITSPSSPLSLPSHSSSSSTSSSPTPPATSHVIAFTADRTFRLLDLHLARPSRYIGHLAYARAVYALDPAGRVAVTSEHSVLIWRLDTWTCEQTLDREAELRAEERLQQRAPEQLSEDTPPPWEEKRAALPFVSAVWPPPSHLSYSSHPLHSTSTRHPTCVCPLWSSSFIATANSQGFVHLWRIGPSLLGQRHMGNVRAHRGRVVQVEYVRGRRLISCGDDGMVRLWQLNCGRGSGSGLEEEGDEGVDSDEWTVRLLFEYAVQSTEGWCGSAAFIPGD